jgi:hypothetical protein
VVKGIVASEARGALYAGAGTFRSDRAGDAALSTAALLALAAVPGQEQTFTAVPPGNGPRAAVDRDLDGALDRDEIDAGASPRDATSVPGGPAFTLIQATSLDLKDRTSPPRPAKRKIAFTSKTASDPVGQRIVPPSPGSASDPTIHGATLVVYDSAGSGETVTIALAPDGWTLGGSPARPSYRYRNASGDAPITRISLRADRLAVSGGGPGFGYTLDEPRQGRVAVRLALGTAAVLCADAPPRTRGRPPTSANYDAVDRFRAAAKTPAPAACPQLPIDG